MAAKNDLSTQFFNWAVPGLQLDAARHFVAYPYDPYFLPSKTASSSPKRIDFQSGIFEPFFLEGDSYTAIENGDRVIGFQDITGNTNYACLNIGGSARPGRSIWGKQYWEVEVIQLPNEVPKQTIFTHSKGYNGSPNGGLFWLTSADNKLHWYPFTTSPSNVPDPSSVFGDGKVVCMYPSAPVGGSIIIEGPCSRIQIEGSSYDADGNYTETLTVTYKWPSYLNTFLNPVIGLWPRCNQFGRNNIIGLDDPNAQYRSIGVTRTSVLQDSVAFTVDDSTDGLFGGAEAGDVAVTSGLANWWPQTPITHLYGDLFRAPDVNTPARSEFASLIGTAIGDCMYAGDGGVTIPFGAGPGRHGPVFKGRADKLKSIKTPGDSDIVNTGGPYPDPSGIWTGVDLGEWGVGDVIMIATDATSRKVWFGKNGNWPSGNPSTGSGWTCLMDGPPDARNYFPGVSFRYGPSHVRVCFQAKKMKYTIPKGFKSFAARYA